MGDVRHGPESLDLRVRNIGGIDETSVQISRGVTALVGENATNRTSLLQAIAAGLGTDSYSLKSDAETGEVSMTVGDETYVREIRRVNNHLETDGDTYLENPSLADLFAVLVASNDVRRAVREGVNLRDLILEPVDTDEIQAQITECVDRRREIDRDLDKLETLEDELAELQEERSRAADELERIDAELSEARARLEALHPDDETRDQSAVDPKLEEKFATLTELRDELDSVTTTIASERKSLESLRESRDTLRDRYEAREPPDETEIARLEERLDGLRQQQRSLDSTITELQQVIRFNNERLESSQSSLGGVLDDGAEDDQSVTDQLNPSEATVTCWTCGSRVEQSSIREMVDQLADLRAEKTDEKNRIADEIETLQDRITELKTRREEYEGIAEQLDALEEKIEATVSTVTNLEERRDTLESRIEELEADVEQYQETQQDELLAVRQTVSDLEYERGRIENELDSLDAQIEETEAALANRDDLLEEREQLSAELEDLRTRIERIEQDAIEAFNTHMNDLLDLLYYENIERIWLEQTEEEVRDGQEETTQRTFDLHIVREDDEGTVYEDTIDHLSESEREVTGLVVALAGYLAHDVHERVPFMLLDSVEMIDGERLADLVSYLEDYVPYLVVVLLPDHARVFERRFSSERHQMIEV